jgi:hypothetical protein
MKPLFEENDVLSLRMIKGHLKLSQQERRHLKEAIGQGNRSGYYHKRKYNCVFTFIDGIYNVKLTYPCGYVKKSRFVLIKESRKCNQEI